MVRTSKITPGLLAQIWSPTVQMGARCDFRASSWNVGGPLLWDPPVGPHGTVVLVVGWSRFDGVDAHLDAVVVIHVTPEGKLLIRSMLASWLTPATESRS